MSVIVRRDVIVGPGQGWEVDIQTDHGWTRISQAGVLYQDYEEPPYSDHQGAWEVLYGQLDIPFDGRYTEFVGGSPNAKEHQD